MGSRFIAVVFCLVISSFSDTNVVYSAPSNVQEQDPVILEVATVAGIPERKWQLDLNILKLNTNCYTVFGP